MYKKMKVKLFLLTLILGLSACRPASQLSGTSWRLVSYGDRTSPQPVLPGQPPTLEFHADGSFGAQTGCNSAGGNYQENGNRIQFHDLVSTLMACVETDRAAQEIAYLEGLNGAQEFDLTANQLVIYYGNRAKALTFSPMP